VRTFKRATLDFCGDAHNICHDFCVAWEGCGFKEMKRALFEIGRALLGVVGCTVAAVMVSLGSVNKPWRGFVPIAFVLVIVLLAKRCGSVVGVAGSITAALIFSYLLYAPLGSFRVEDLAERRNIAWMMLGGIVIPFLLLPPGGHGEAEKHSDKL
jgi:K+-sensing histidine kinase KdpD